MPLRFRRTIKVAPGVKLNLSKSGMSTTVGPKGFHFTFGKRGIRRSIGIPGTGISEVDYIKKNDGNAEPEHRHESAETREERAEERREERHAEEAQRSGHSTGLRNLFVLLAVVIVFVAGAMVLGILPANFVSSSLQYLAHLAQSTGH